MSLLIFAAYVSAVTHNALQWAGQPQKLPLSVGGFGPYLIQFLKLTRVTRLNGVTIGLAVFCRTHKAD